MDAVEMKETDAAAPQQKHLIFFKRDASLQNNEQQKRHTAFIYLQYGAFENKNY